MLIVMINVNCLSWYVFPEHLSEMFIVNKTDFPFSEPIINTAPTPVKTDSIII